MRMRIFLALDAERWMKVLGNDSCNSKNVIVRPFAILDTWAKRIMIHNQSVQSNTPGIDIIWFYNYFSVMLWVFISYKMEDIKFEWSYSRINYWHDPGANWRFPNQNSYVSTQFFFNFRSAGASGARTGHEDAADSEQTVLFRRQTEPQRSLYQSSWGECFSFVYF